LPCYRDLALFEAKDDNGNVTNGAIQIRFPHPLTSVLCTLYSVPYGASVNSFSRPIEPVAGTLSTHGALWSRLTYGSCPPTSLSALLPTATTKERCRRESPPLRPLHQPETNFAETYKWSNWRESVCLHWGTAMLPLASRSRGPSALVAYYYRMHLELSHPSGG